MVLKSATFKLSLPPELTEQMRFLVSRGLTSKETVEIDGVKVRPCDVLLKVVSQIPRPAGKVNCSQPGGELEPFARDLPAAAALSRRCRSLHSGHDE